MTTAIQDKPTTDNESVSEPVTVQLEANVASRLRAHAKRYYLTTDELAARVLGLWEQVADVEELGGSVNTQIPGGRPQILRAKPGPF